MNAQERITELERMLKEAWNDGWETGAYAIVVGCKPIHQCDAYVEVIRTRRRNPHEST